MALNKSLENINSLNNDLFAFDSKYVKRMKIKQLKKLRSRGDALKKNISTLEKTQKMLENSLPDNSNIIDNNIRKSKLKDITQSRNNFIQKLEKINEKIDILLNEEKIRKNIHKHNLTDVEDAEREKFNIKLEEMQKKEKKIRRKYEKDIEKTIGKKNEEYDRNEKNLTELKIKLFNDSR